jgi:putative oxidoreductase
MLLRAVTTHLRRSAYGVDTTHRANHLWEFFVFNGLNHFMNLGMMSGYAGSKGTPAPKVAVVGTGVMLMVGGLSVVLGVLPVIGLILIVLFLVPVAVVMHDFWAVPEEGKMNEQVNFMKNMELAGAALALMYGASSLPLAIWP